jgi:hypothetical protein
MIKQNMKYNHLLNSNPIKKVIIKNSDETTTSLYYKYIDGINKLHNYSGAAILNIDLGIKEFYLFGVKYSEIEFKKRVK